ncbi:aspartate aminotransferase family protein [Gilvibacter sp.]|uniref:aspartate aminotransferase family protein n=1 Tax=Gilvibacter sp. TaxID=2729997 RepID=UPI003B51F988
MLEDFFKHQAQTTPHPLAMQVQRAEGSYIYDIAGNAHLDFVAGVSACSLGHRHPRVVSAVKKQLDSYLHVMVYGEYVQEPVVTLAKKLAEALPDPLDTTYFTNSGTEAIEGAIKLARRVTGRSELIAANKAYHGSTMGSLSLMGFEERKSAFRPLIPDCRFINFNHFDGLEKITEETAGVVVETIQGGAGFIVPEKGYLKALSARCKEVGALLILDEIQPGFGRTGKLFGFMHYDLIPDIVVMGKGMGGGLPVGAFTASAAQMKQLQDNPKLGHITTFGGNPVIAAAALATLKELQESTLMADTLKKEALFRSLLKHPLIKEVRGKGLMLALIMESAEIANTLVLEAQKAGLILFWLLFEPKAVRITPPLTVSESEIRKGCQVILDLLEKIDKK